MQRREPRRRATNRGNPRVIAAVLEVVDNQLRENDPPEVRLTLERLVRSGFSNEVARRYIGMAVLFEMNEVMRAHAPFDRARYVAALDRLPQIS